MINRLVPFVSDRELEKQRILVVDGRSIPLTIRRHRRARRIILRLAADGEGAVVTLPLGAHSEDGIAFARRHADWIARRLARLAPRIPLADGALIPYLGVEHRVRHTFEPPAGVRLDDQEIVVATRLDDVHARLAGWFRREARRAIAPRVAEKAERLGRAAGKISVRDQRSRWGSCSAGGNLSFSWRLVMAPEAVLDYVVAHEVAHLAVRNHSPAFWETVAKLTDGIDTPRRWLARHGRGLHRYG